jgi:hypothetical protein
MISLFNNSILSNPSHLEITMCIGMALILCLACNPTSLLISLIGNGNNVVVVKAVAVAAAGYQQEQSLSRSLP